MNKPNILIFCSFSVFGGAETYVLEMYKKLRALNYSVKIVIPKNSILQQKLLEQKLPFYSYFKIRIFKTDFQPWLNNILYKICKRNKIQIIHFSSPNEIKYAKKAIRRLKVKTIVTRHVPNLIKTKYLPKFDGIIGVSPKISNDLKSLYTKEKINSIKIERIPPFFDDKKFLNFTTTQNKNLFFKNEFGITLLNHPMLCMVATFDFNKNQTLLLHAAHKLIYEKSKPINIILCGKGVTEKKLKTLIKKLNLENFAHIIYTTAQIPEIFFHSDITVLTSRMEANPIVLFEAALLKKPLIGPQKTGVENSIIHEKTGLLFENNNVDDLVQKIETLIDNPELQKKYGNNAYEHIKNNLTSDVTIKKLEKFYKEIIN